MFKPLFYLVAVGLLCLGQPVSALAGKELIAIAYHDVVNHRDDLTSDAVTLDNLINQFEWIKINGYHPVSVDDLEAARAGTRSLPDKPILLCWDDAYTSFYTHVLPLLKAYHYPAVLALVGSWLTPGQGDMVQYGNALIPRERFMTWEQIKEVAASGIVEIASHSYNLHSTVLADRSKDPLPAAMAHIFDSDTGTYETDQQFRQRIRSDLITNNNLIMQHIGRKPRVVVWPFGRYNMVAHELALEAGMPITLTLNPVPADSDQLEEIGRFYPLSNPDLRTFRSFLDPRIRPPRIRFIRVDSHDLLENSVDKEEHFSLFLDRVKNIDPNIVIIDPVVEDKGKLKTLFINRRFPVAQDRLNRLCWQTSKRAGAGVLLWISPPLFTPRAGENAETITQFFSDMGKSAPGKGLVVNNPDLVQALLQMAGNNSGRETELRFWNPEKQHRARQIISKQDNFPQIARVFQALEAFQQWQPFQEIGLVLTKDQLQDLTLKHFNVLFSFFDFIIIDTGNTSIQTMSATLDSQLKLLQDSGYLDKCVFMLSTERKDSTLAGEIYQLPSHNIINWGYQFDRFLEGTPSLTDLRPLMSKRSFPYPLSY